MILPLIATLALAAPSDHWLSPEEEAFIAPLGIDQKSFEAARLLTRYTGEYVDPLGVDRVRKDLLGGASPPSDPSASKRGRLPYLIDLMKRKEWLPMQ